VRWAFALKGIACEMIPINLLNEEAESAEHRKRNPLGFVPVLEVLDRERLHYLAESIAIIEWAEETRPEPRLLPGDTYQRARIRQLAELVNAGTQPLQNLNTQHFHAPDNAEEQKRWNRHWIRNGLAAYETLIQETAGRYSVGDSITMADLFLIPQCYNAWRHEIPLSEYPAIERIHASAILTESCQASHPDRFQPA
jgi:maleylpyruvate isomerase